MAELRRQFDTGAVKLDTVANQAGNVMTDVALLWAGPDGEMFRGQWVRVHRRTLIDAAKALRQASEIIEKNRQAQIDTSAAGEGTRGTYSPRQYDHRKRSGPFGWDLPDIGFPKINLDLPGFDLPSWPDITKAADEGFDALTDTLDKGLDTVRRAAGDVWDWGKDGILDLLNPLDDAAIFTIMTTLRTGRTALSLGLDGLNWVDNLILPFGPDLRLGDDARDAWNRYVVPGLVHELMGLADPFFESVSTGDPGGWLTDRENRPFDLSDATGADGGRAAVMQALADTKDSDQIQADEFELIDHHNGSYTLVLPGVTDLTKPNQGLNPFNQSSRDTDVGAAYSVADSNPNAHLYGIYIQEYLKNHVPPGSSLSIVGHSYGADTALDLASDPTFNGELYNVTHVTAAGYHSEPQYSSIPSGTQVLGLQNNKDIAVIVEELGHASSTKDSAPFVGEVSDAFNLGPDNITHKEFDGGWAGIGHDPSNYSAYVQSTNDPEVIAFLESLDAAGYTSDGSSLAVDISVPVPSEEGP